MEGQDLFFNRGWFGVADLKLSNFQASHGLWVQGPKREIQYARKTDPRQIGQQKKC